jgi:hypothetical protein
MVNIEESEMNRVFKGLLACVLALVALAAQADVFTPYDGPTGMTHYWYNRGGAIRWNALGGDYGEQVGQVLIAANKTAPVTIDITPAAGAEGVFLNAGTSIKFRSRNSQTGPGPLLLINGEPTHITVIADANLTTSATPAGTSGLLTTGASPFMVYFSEPLPANATSITLTFDVYRSFSMQVTLKAYRAFIPRIEDEEPTLGLANNYENDSWIVTHPDVLHVIDFDDPNWFEFSNRPDEGGNREFCSTIETPDSLGGGKALRSLIDATRYSTGCSHHFYAPKYNDNALLDEVYMRYYVRLGADYHGSTDGGKMPGIASQQWYDGQLLCGGSGTTCAGGGKGWTLRGGFNMNNDVNNPVYPRVLLHTYAYHAQQAGGYGDIWTWGARGLVELEKWTAVEWHVKVNTPGIANGVLQVWVDGLLAMDRQDIILRGDESVWDARLMNNMLINSAPWIVHFYGGKEPPYVRDHTALFDNFVMAKSYIGPMRTTALR